MTSNSRILQSGDRIMGNSGNIIKDASLVFWYDPSRPESYPGAGTDLFDLSGNNFHAKQGATPIFTGNSFSYPTSGNSFSSEIYLPLFSAGPYGATYNITITLWFKSDSSARYLYPLALSGGGGNFEFDINDTDSGSSYQTMWIYWNSGGSPLSALSIGALGGALGKSDLLTGTWQCYTFRRDISTKPYTEHFVNGVKIETGQRLDDQIGGLYYGGVLQFGSVSSYTGEIGSLHAYSRPLSDREVLFNYNTEKNRFPV